MLITYNLKFIAQVSFVLSILLFNISILPALAFPFREFKEGDPVPDVTLVPLDAEKSQISFSGLKGKPFIVIFWGADLPEKIKYSAQILDEVEKLAPFLNDRNVQRYSVNVQNDDGPAIEEVLNSSKSTIDVFKDENQKAYEALGIFVMPAVLLVDGNGYVAAGFGYSHDLVDRLRGSIEIMLGEKTAEQVAAELRPEMKEVSDETKASRRHFNFGLVMVKRGQLDSAIREFSKAVEIDPGMIEAHLQLGCLFLDRKDTENAEKAINKALEADPESIQGKICRAELLRLKSQLDEAEKLVMDVSSSHPENHEAYYIHGRILEDRSKSKEAMQIYKKAYKSILMYAARDK